MRKRRRILPAGTGERTVGLGAGNSQQGTGNSQQGTEEQKRAGNRTTQGQDETMLTIDAVHLREINMPLAFPFETSFGPTTTRRILLVEIESGGMTAWGECVAGEHPYFSDECIDTAWTDHRERTRASSAGQGDRWRRELSRALPPGARAPHGQGGAGERGVGAGGAAEASAAGEAAGWNAQRDSVRRLDWNSAVARGADGEDRRGAGGGLSAHQAEVQAGLGHEDL